MICTVVILVGSTSSSEPASMHPFRVWSADNESAMRTAQVHQYALMGAGRS